MVGQLLPSHWGFTNKYIRSMGLEHDPYTYVSFLYPPYPFRLLLLFSPPLPSLSLSSTYVLVIVVFDSRRYLWMAMHRIGREHLNPATSIQVTVSNHFYLPLFIIFFLLFYFCFIMYFIFDRGRSKFSSIMYSCSFSCERDGSRLLCGEQRRMLHDSYLLLFFVFFLIFISFFFFFF